MKGTKSNNNQKKPLPQSWRNFVRKLLALGDIDVTFVWPAWPLVTLAWLLRGRRGAFSGGALGRTLRFVWQAWRLVTLAWLLCGRRGTYGTGLALVARLVARGAATFCVAGVGATRNMPKLGLLGIGPRPCSDQVCKLSAHRQQSYSKHRTCFAIQELAVSPHLRQSMLAGMQGTAEFV